MHHRPPVSKPRRWGFLNALSCTLPSWDPEIAGLRHSKQRLISASHSSFPILPCLLSFAIVRVRTIIRRRFYKSLILHFLILGAFHINIMLLVTPPGSSSGCLSVSLSVRPHPAHLAFTPFIT